MHSCRGLLRMCACICSLSAPSYCTIPSTKDAMHFFYLDTLRILQPSISECAHLSGLVEGALVGGLSQQDICGPPHVVPVRDQAIISSRLIGHVLPIVLVHVGQKRLQRPCNGSVHLRQCKRVHQHIPYGPPAAHLLLALMLAKLKHKTLVRCLQHHALNQAISSACSISIEWEDLHIERRVCSPARQWPWASRQQPRSCRPTRWCCCTTPMLRGSN